MLFIRFDGTGDLPDGQDFSIRIPSGKKSNRRDFLFTATYSIGAVGIGATIWPFIDQMNPDSSVKALATTEVDISQIEPGKSITVLWRGKPVFIKRRTELEINEAQAVSLDDLKHPEKDQDRVKKPEWLVMMGICNLGSGSLCQLNVDLGSFNKILTLPNLYFDERTS